MSLETAIILILVCMFLAAFFSGIETGIIAVHRVRLRHQLRQGTKAARLIQGYLDKPDRLFGTTLVGTNICVVACSVVAESMVADLPGRWWEFLAGAVMTALLLVFSEYIPKAWFYAKPYERASRFVRELRWAETILHPIAISIVWITKLVVRGQGEAFAKVGPFMTKEDMKMLMHEGERDGALSRDARGMIHGVFELSNRKAKDLMVPLEKVKFVSSDMTVPEFLEFARTATFTRIPVFDREKNQFIGIVNLFFVVSAAPEENRTKTMSHFARKPLMISANMAVDDIVPLMRRSRQPMCLVTDETAKVVGVITDEDILKDVVGKLP